MIWAPFVLALVLGLVIAGALYLGYMWPEVEREEPAAAPPPPAEAAAE